MRITQHDIARKAGVSQSTVSRVLSGDRKVDPSLRHRVRQALEAENYHPNVRAAGLRKRTSGQVGLVLKRPQGSLVDDPFISLLISALTDVLNRRKYLLCVDVASSAEEQAVIYEQLLRSDRVDGVVLLEPEAGDPRFARLLEDSFPFVVIGDPGEVAAPAVDNDNDGAAYLAARHLIEAGCEEVGMLAGPQGVRFSDDRVRGYVRAVREAGQAPRVWHSDFGLHAAGAEASRALDGSRRPDGLVVLDDIMAVGAAREASRRGLRMPADLAMVAFNNSSFCELVEGGLTSIDLNIETVIRTAADQLLDILMEKKTCQRSRSLIPCSLVVRGSSLREARS